MPASFTTGMRPTWQLGCSSPGLLARGTTVPLREAQGASVSSCSTIRTRSTIPVAA